MWRGLKGVNHQGLPDPESRRFEVGRCGGHDFTDKFKEISRSWRSPR